MVGDNREAQRGDRAEPDGQSVQTDGQIHRIARARDDQDNHGYVEGSEIEHAVGHERQHGGPGVLRRCRRPERHDQTYGKAQRYLAE